MGLINFLQSFGDKRVSADESSPLLPSYNEKQYSTVSTDHREKSEKPETSATSETSEKSEKSYNQGTHENNQHAHSRGARHNIQYPYSQGTLEGGIQYSCSRGTYQDHLISLRAPHEHRHLAPQWKWTTKECRAWLVTMCVQYLELERLVAEEIAARFDGDGPTIFTKAMHGWQDLVGAARRWASFTMIANKFFEPGAVPHNVTIDGDGMIHVIPKVPDVKSSWWAEFLCGLVGHQRARRSCT